MIWQQKIFIFGMVMDLVNSLMVVGFTIVKKEILDQFTAFSGDTLVPSM
jgi:hypothetical protein